MPIAIVATARGEFRPADKVMRFTRPDDAVVGDELVVLLVCATAEVADTAHLPAGWGTLVTGNTANYRLYVTTHSVLSGELAVVDFPLQPGVAVAHEWLGFLLVVRGANDACIEGFAGQDFAAVTAIPQSGTGGVEQATSILVGVNLAVGTTFITGSFFANDVFYQTEQIDQFAQAVLEPFTISFCSRIAAETTLHTFANGSAPVAVSGTNTTIVIRDGRPHTPLELFDVVPGNLGLLAKDTRFGAGGIGTATNSGGGHVGTVGH